MSSKTIVAWGAAVLLALGAGGLRYAGGEEDDSPKLLLALSKSKHTLAQGIQQAAAKAPEAAISAKFEMEEGKLSLSVYTAEKGLGVEAEKNVLKELAGDPTAEKWTPETEVFKDVPHVSRASEQLALMSLSSSSLLDIVKKAEKDHGPGVVFSITPVLRERKAEFVVLFAMSGEKVVELRYDLMTGQSIAQR